MRTKVKSWKNYNATKEGFRYSKEMEKFICANYEKYGPKKTAQLFNKKFNLNKSATSICQKADRLGLNFLSSQQSPLYTKEMEEFLVRNYDKFSVKETTRLFNETFNTNKTPDAIKTKAFALHLQNINHPRKPIYKSKELIDFVKTNYDAKITYKDLCEKVNKKFNLNLTQRQLRYFIYNKLKLDVKKRTYKKAPKPRHDAYTDKQKNWLKQNSQNNTAKTLTKLFNQTFKMNKSESAIKQACCKEGFKINVKIFYTEKQKEFLKTNAPHCSAKELTTLFNEEFKTNKKVDTIKSVCMKNKWHLSHKNKQKYKVGDIIVYPSHPKVQLIKVSKEEAKLFKTLNDPLCRIPLNRYIWWKNTGHVPQEDEVVLVLDKDKGVEDFDNLVLIPKKIDFLLSSNQHRHMANAFLQKKAIELHIIEEKLREEKHT